MIHGRVLIRRSLVVRALVFVFAILTLALGLGIAVAGLAQGYLAFGLIALLFVSSIATLHYRVFAIAVESRDDVLVVHNFSFTRRVARAEIARVDTTEIPFWPSARYEVAQLCLTNGQMLRLTATLCETSRAAGRARLEECVSQLNSFVQTGS